MANGGDVGLFENYQGLLLSIFCFFNSMMTFLWGWVALPFAGPRYEVNHGVVNFALMVLSVKFIL